MSEPIPTAPATILSLTLAVLALLLMTLFNSAQLLRDHNDLSDQHAAQEANLQDSINARQKANQIAVDTAKLADSGNANAKAIVDDLAKQGISLRVPKQ